MRNIKLFERDCRGSGVGYFKGCNFVQINNLPVSYFNFVLAPDLLSVVTCLSIIFFFHHRLFPVIVHCLTFMNAGRDAVLNDCMMDTAQSFDMRTGTLVSIIFDGAGIFNFRHSSSKQSDVFVMLLDSKN